MPHITPRGQAKISALAELQRAVDTLYGLTEQFAAARSHEEQISQQIRRRYGKFKIALLGAGFDQLAQLATGMEIAAGRGGAQRTKTRILREGIASIRFQLEMEEKLIRQSETVGGEEEEEGKE